MFGRKKKDSSENDDLQQMYEMGADTSPGEAPAVLREVARLNSDLVALKRRNLRIWSTNIILSLGLVGTITGVIYAYPKYRYIATTDNQAICEVSPESAPRVSVADVTNFAKDAVLNTYSYDYVNYRTVINEAASRWYTPEGRQAFMQGLDSSGNLEQVIKGRMILRSMATQTPQLEEVSPATGNPRSWTVIVPIAIEFYKGGAAKPLSRQDFRAFVTVVRVQASATNQQGIAVKSVILRSPRGL